MFIVCLNDGPGCCPGMGALQHFKFCPGKIVPALLYLQVDFTEFPLLQRIGLAHMETFSLYLFTDTEIEFDQQAALAYQILFESHYTLHEVEVLFFGTKLEHRLNQSTVIPAAVEDRDLPSPGQLRDIFLEIPLTVLLPGGLAQRNNTVVPRIHIEGYALDGTTLACCIASFE